MNDNPIGQVGALIDAAEHSPEEAKLAQADEWLKKMRTAGWTNLVFGNRKMARANKSAVKNARRAQRIKEGRR